jgi:glycosidase
MKCRFLALLLAVAAGCGTYHFGPDGSADDMGDTGGGGDDGGIPSTGDGGVVPQRACGTTFTFHGAAPTAVSVAGEFNNWDTSANKLTGPDSMGNWSATVMLMPGNYAYKVVTSDSAGALTWQLDPATPYTKFVGGVENSLVEVDDCKTPLLQFKALTKTADGALHAEVQYLDGSAAAGIDLSTVTVMLDGAAAGGASIDGNGLITVDSTGLAKTKHRLIFHAADKGGHAAADLHVPFWIEDQPFDFRDGLMYFPFTDRFRNGDPSNDKPTDGVDARANYQGGDWAGIEQTIKDGYFDALGVRTLWLSPPNLNPDGGFTGTGGHLYTGYHGYWPSSGRDVQPRFGTLAELKSLVATAHAHGIRVIVDAVLNHVHQESPYWQMHQNDNWFNPESINNQQCICGTGPANGCGDWDSTQPDGYHGFLPRFTCWFQPYMPDLDYTNYDTTSAMIDDALFWAREVDVDGFRVDAVKHFLLTATTRLRGKLHDTFEWTGPLFYTVGETYTGDRGLIQSFIGPNALHAQFDFAIYFSVINTLARYSSSLRELESATAASDAAFGDEPMSPFAGNHDTARFLSIANGDGDGEPWSAPAGTPSVEDPYFKLRLALTFVATSPGVPLIYYGDDYGQPGAGDPDNRRFMKLTGLSPFEQATLDVAKKLGAARKELVALRRGDRKTLWIDDDHYVFARTTTNKDVAIVVLNRSFGGTWTQAVPVPSYVPLPDGTVLKDRLGGPSVTVTGGTIPISQGAHSSAVYAP